MVGALWTGISGLSGSQMGLDNESNNIANVNTIGYKASRVSFADQMYQDKIGKGVTSFDVEKMYTQGNLKITGVSYDMALSGDGFFQLSDGNDTYYSRAGNFRMGESGNLEDVGQNNVQGWAIASLSADDIISTDSNATFFTNDFSKVLGNKVIRDTSSIETIAAKATDYNTTAVSDSKVIYTGAGYKSASTKKADVEALITEYNAALTVYSEADPKPTASVSRSQRDLLDFDMDSATLAEGDEVYAYIDGTKYSVSFRDDNETTMKDFVDLMSDTTGFNANLADVGATGYEINTSSATGQVVLESLIPGQAFRITEFGWTDASNSNQTTKGVNTNLQQAVLGSGMGHIESIEEALATAISGKQMDVYPGADLIFDGAATYTYQIDIYNKDTMMNETIPTIPLSDTPADLDAWVAMINTNTSAIGELADHVKAYNINGNLVIKTLDANDDVEFTGTMTGHSSAPSPEINTITLSASTGAGTVVTTINGQNYTTTVGAADTAADVATAIAAQINADLIATPDSAIATVTASGDDLVITYTAATGAIADATHALGTALGATGVVVETAYAATTTGASLLKDPNYSGREGAAAEFLKITTTINQTASKGDIQLRLDTLGITDSAFGAFSVDNTGLITMQQDGVDFAIGQVAVARFTDNRGLEAVGDNLLKSTIRSGTAIFNENNDKMAEVKGGQLELSTADLSESLVNLMVFQRAFEANAKSITTADQILTTLIQLKR